jgi:transcriptional regulator with XRE-family HTH domain
MAVSEKSGMSQSKLSKLETGALLPSAEDLNALAKVLQLSKPKTEQLVNRLRSLRTEYASWRLGLDKGLAARQIDVAERERQAPFIWEFQVCAIPGLLQLPGYAHRVMTLANVTNQKDIEAGVAERIRRQTILYDGKHKFRYLMTQTALYSRFCDRHLVVQQLQFLQTFFRLPNVTIGVLPDSTPLPDIPQNNFGIWGSEVVVIETFAGMITITDERDMKFYHALFERFSSAALFGRAAQAFLDECQKYLENLPEPDQTEALSGGTNIRHKSDARRA